MDHDVVVRQKMTERYLLDELDSEVRGEFEEHFFDCPVCALDVRAGAMFVEQSKFALAERPAETSVPLFAPATGKPGWSAWLRPAFAVPLMVLLLAVIGYQNLVTIPNLVRTFDRPTVLPWAMVNIGVWGSGGPLIPTRVGEGFGLIVRIPPEAGYSYYTLYLYDPAGIQEWSERIPATPGQDQWMVQVPGAKRAPGRYTLSVRGVTNGDETREVGRTSFDLQIQK